MLSFGLDILVEQNLVSHMMTLLENFAAKLEDPVEARKVLKAKTKLDGYHQGCLRICQRIAQYEAPLAALKDKSSKMESRKEEIDKLFAEYHACYAFIRGLKVQMTAATYYVASLHQKIIDLQADLTNLQKTTLPLPSGQFEFLLAT